MAESSSGHVLYVVDAYPELSQTFVRLEVEALADLGLDVQVLALQKGDDPSHERPGRVPWRVVPRPQWRRRALTSHLWWMSRHPRRYLAFWAGVHRLGRQHLRLALTVVPLLTRDYTTQGITRCHAHFAWGASAVAHQIANLLGVPTSMTVHARDIYLPAGNLQAKLDACDLVVTVCNYNVRWLREHGYRCNDVEVIACGVLVPPTCTQPEEAGADVVAVGRLVPKKGFDVLLAATAQVMATHPDLHVTIVGAGPEQVALEAQRSRLGLDDVVELLGALPHEQSLQHISRGRVFCLPSRYAADGDSDALPVVLREAMARSRPVVTTSVAGIPETVDATTGWVVDPDDPQALAEALAEVLAEPAAARQRGRAARARMEEKYTVAGEAKRLHALFEARTR